MKRPLRIALGGSTGRMGRAISALADQDSRISVAASLSRKNAAQAPKLLQKADLLIDFSLPAGSMKFISAAAKRRLPVVAGSTGYSAAQERGLRSLSKRIPLFLAPNTSPGMNLLFELARRAAASLPNYDARLIDIHHSAKKDAPSGSAKRIVESVRKGRKGAVPTVSIRAGNIVAEHTLMLVGPLERIELSHRAQSRDVFARGALDAALWLRGRKPGLYGMKQMLGL